jgi:hypothetical protein
MCLITLLSASYQLKTYRSFSNVDCKLVQPDMLFVHNWHVKNDMTFKQKELQLSALLEENKSCSC